jgi:hypothetical protein
MGVPIVEVRVWTSYPGQFPGERAVENDVTLRLQDPRKQLTDTVEKLERFEWRLRLFEREDVKASLLDRILIIRTRRRIRKTRLQALRSLKKAVRGTVTILESSGEAFYELEGLQWRELPESLEKANRIRLFAFEAKGILKDGQRKTGALAEIKP